MHQGTDESTVTVDSAVPLIDHDPDRSWITDLDPDHPKEMHLKCFVIQYRSELSEPKTRVLNEPLTRLNSQRVIANAKGPRVFSNALAFVIHNQDSFCDALLWRTKHDFSSKQMRDL